MPLYESTLIARPDISGQQVDGLTEQIKDIIDKNGGTIAKTEYWGLRTLTYKVKKNRRGHYLHMRIDSPSDAIAEMERIMRINEDVMRYLTIRVDSLDEKDSPMMQSKGPHETRTKPGYENGNKIDEVDKKSSIQDVSPEAETNTSGESDDSDIDNKSESD